MDGFPVGAVVVPLGVEFIQFFLLLFDPGVVFEVVDALFAVEVQFFGVVGGDGGQQFVVFSGVNFGVFAPFFVEFFHAGVVEFHGVGEDGENDIVTGEFVVAGEFDGGEEVGDAGDAQQVEVVHQFRVNSLFFQVGTPFWFVEEPNEAHGMFVVDGGDHVGVSRVVNPGDVFVADAFDAVAAEAVEEQGGALEGFTDDEFGAGVLFFEEVGAAHGAGGTGGEDDTGVFLAGFHFFFQDFQHGVSGDFVVPEVVAEFVELVEDDDVVTPFFVEFPAFVEDFFDVAFAAGGGDDFTGDVGEPFKAFL